MADRTTDAWIAAKIGAPGAALSVPELQTYQLVQLNATLRRVRARSPFYRRHLAYAPAELTGLDELQTLPFTSAQDIRSEGLQLLCVSQDDIHRIVTLDSSGTTGAPKRIFFTRADQELTTDYFHHGMGTFTDPGDRVLILLPGETPGSVGDLLASALSRLGAQPIKHGVVRDVGETLAVMRRERIDGLVGIPSQVHALAMDGAGLKLKSVLLTTDHVPNAIVRNVEAAWGCGVYNHYGMTEMGLGGGVDCTAHRGYHLREADMLFEVIEPVTGLSVPDGAEGEVVFTTLTRTGMPLIRYRTGDLSRFVPGACTCGTQLRTLERIRARAGGAVVMGDGKLALWVLDEALFAIPGLMNFTATVVHGEQDRLVLEIRTVEGRGEEVTRAVGSALEAIAVLESARRAGRFEVDVVMVGEGYVLSGAAKRRIGEQSSV